MGQIIENELKKIMAYAETQGEKFNREKAFDFLTVQYYCYQSSKLDNIWYDIITSNLTDGKNDGGIDFVFFDDEEGRVVIGQNKLSKNITRTAAIAEIRKTIHTLENFDKKNVQSYNSDVRKNVQNALDRLTDETIGSIDIVFFHTSQFNQENVKKDVKDQNVVSNIDFLNEEELEELISKVKSEIQLVEEHKFNLDDSKNYLTYDNDDKTGVIVNISAKSLIDAFNKYNSEGLFNLNIRRYIRSKAVDEGINQTLNDDRDNFWFLNNGLTIACDDFDIDGNVLKLYDFSIVNGGQTTTLIANYTGKNNDDFFIPCKIVKSKKILSDSERLNFFNDIAEATNSQKPIQPRDLKSNSPEMIQLQKLLGDHGIFLEIKRGISAPKRFKKKIKNDELAQIIFSFVNQKPGTARSNKRSLFSINKNYNFIFRKNYVKDPQKSAFLFDLVDLNDRFYEISTNLKKNAKEKFIFEEELNVFSNGKMIIFSILGLFYRIINEDLSINEILRQPNLLENSEFMYGKFIKNYKKDDINNILEYLIVEITQELTECYKLEYGNGKVTSISNFFKTDKKYYEVIVPFILKNYRVPERWDKFIPPYKELFLRS